jgi:hypothetical protein
MLAAVLCLCAGIVWVLFGSIPFGMPQWSVTPRVSTRTLQCYIVPSGLAIIFDRSFIVGDRLIHGLVPGALVLLWVLGTIFLEGWMRTKA